ncbi:MAG: Aspartate carbamoyltransferase regulatory chain (PyrI) [Candidatus Rifleibacterium amylolyticum]|nr:MAG: Aspartate carbamoyltransferase regulatory chain (PyrI) [Candidatus Rifleibacterium amylolyticum]NLF95835.1 aspartate carbamoyltransferase regulatory subunit [Candidatus Riflebacteria bacterium]
MSPEQILLIPKIENGFVLDHIPAGSGVKILNLIRGHHELNAAVLSVGLHYTSRRLGRKDLIKIQCGELPQRFLQHLSLVVPGVTIKRVENFAIARKIVLEPPELVDNLLSCPNPGCITNHERGVTTCFHLVRREPMKFRCNHCERWFALAELENRLKL